MDGSIRVFILLVIEIKLITNPVLNKIMDIEEYWFSSIMFFPLLLMVLLLLLTWRLNLG